MSLDYTEKQAILTLKLDVIQKRISKWYHRAIQQVPEEEQFFIMDKKQIMIKKFNKRHGRNMWYKAQLLNHARYKRKQRIQDKIESIVLNGHGIFMTLTFTDEILDSTSEHTRRRYVARWCKENSSFYVANVDYGDKTNREHYHAVLEQGNFTPWKYGHISRKLVRSKSKDLTKVSKYVSKLTNHAIKKSGKLKRIIYSKKLV